MSLAPNKIRVGVLRGGPSPEYEVSLKTGSTILSNLSDQYVPIDVIISKDGQWHTGGLQKSPYQILKSVDVVLNAMHGEYGEDGTVQKMLEDFNVPYSGSDSIASSLGSNKVLSKNLFKKLGLLTPHHLEVKIPESLEVNREIINNINENIIFPVIIKPIRSGSSLGVSFAQDLRSLREALEESSKHSRELMVEEYINGKELASGVIEGFRGHDFYTLLPAMFSNFDQKKFHDFDSKYLDLGQSYQIPANLSNTEKEEIMNASIQIHKAFGLKHYSKCDFILHPKRGLFVLEVNTLPHISHRSPFVQSIESIGSNLKEFLNHLIEIVFKK